MKKRIAAGTLCAAMLCTSAFAGNMLIAPNPINEEVPAVTAPAQMPYAIGLKATVKQVNKVDDRISLWVEDAEGAPTILHINADTVVIDNKTAQPAVAGDIKPGDEIYAYHDLVMAMSYPGQTDAQVILTNVKDGMPAHLHTVESVSRKDGVTSALCDQGSIYVSANEDTALSPYLTRNIVTQDNIRMGTRVLAWYDIVALSFPGQATATKMVVLPQDFTTREVTVSVGGKTVQGKYENGTVVAPARAVAEALGFELGWNEAAETVTLTKGDLIGEVVVGGDQYTWKNAAGETVAQSDAFAVGAYLENGDTTWAPIELFGCLPNMSVSLVRDVVTVNAW